MLVRDQKYTLDFLLSDEGMQHMNDMPFLQVEIDGELWPVQQSHVTDEQMLSIEGMVDLKWIYKRTTHEEIPLFVAEDSEKALKLFDYTDGNEDCECLVTPKGYPW